jgi:hypothetical protein
VAAVDALSRDAAARLLASLLDSPQAELARRAEALLAPLRPLLPLRVPTPVEALSRLQPAVALTAEDQEALSTVRGVVQLLQRLQAAPGGGALAAGGGGVRAGVSAGAALRGAAAAAVELRPLVAELLPGVMGTGEARLAAGGVVLGLLIDARHFGAGTERLLASCSGAQTHTWYNTPSPTPARGNWSSAWHLTPPAAAAAAPCPPPSRGNWSSACHLTPPAAAAAAAAGDMFVRALMRRLAMRVTEAIDASTQAEPSEAELSFVSAPSWLPGGEGRGVRLVAGAPRPGAGAVGGGVGDAGAVVVAGLVALPLAAVFAPLVVAEHLMRAGQGQGQGRMV